MTYLRSFFIAFALILATVMAADVLPYEYDFAQSSTSKVRSDYWINLMWINKSLNPNQEFLPIPDNEKSKHTSNFFTAVKEWAQQDPTYSIVNVWYDSAYTTPEALRRTQDRINAEGGNSTKRAPIYFRDIRTLPIVKDNEEVFHASLPVYFRADLLRVIASYHALTAESCEYFVYADLDITPFPKNDLLGANMKALNKFGILMAHRTADVSFENYFHITTRQSNLLKAIKHVLIDLNIVRAYSALYKGKHQRHPTDKNLYSALAERVFHSYTDMFAYFYHLQGWGKLCLNLLGPNTLGQGTTLAVIQECCNRFPKNSFYLQCLTTPYDPTTHGLDPFGIDEFASYPIQFQSIQSNLTETDLLYNRCLFIPTMYVSAPPPSADYYDSPLANINKTPQKPELLGGS